MKKRFLSLILAAALLFGNAFAFAEGDIENTDIIPAVTETAQTQTPVTDQAEEPEPASPSSGEPASEPESEAADVPEQPVRQEEDTEPETVSEQADSDSAEPTEGTEPAGTTEAVEAADTVEPEDISDTCETSETADDPDTNGGPAEPETTEEEQAQEETENGDTLNEGAQDEQPQIDYTKSVKDNELFNKGYVVFSSVELYQTEDDSEAYARISGGIAYASRRVNKGSASDKVLINFATEEGTLRAFVKSSAVKPLSEDAFESFRANFDKLPLAEKAYYNNDPSMPLQILSINIYETEPGQPGEEPGDEPEPEQPGDEPGDEPEPEQPGDEPGDEPGHEEPGDEPVDEPEPEQPGDEPGDEPEPEQPGEQPGDEPEPEQPGDEPEPEQPGDEPEPEQPGDDPEPEQPGDEPGDEPEPEQPGDEPSDEPEPEQPGDEPEPEQPGDEPEPEQPGDEPGDEPQPEQPGDEPCDEPEPEQPGDEPGHEPEPEQPGDEPEPEQPGDEPGNEPEPEQPGDEPGDEPEPEQPGDEPSENEIPEISESEFEARFDSFSLETQLRMLNAFAPKSGFRFSKAYMFMGRGDETDLAQLLVGSGEFSISDDAVASLSGNVLTALAEGHVTVTAANGEGKTAKIVIYVVREPSSLAFSKTTYTVSVGTVFAPAYSFDRNISTVVTWYSSDESVAIVDAAGTVTAVSTGTAVISVESYNGLRANLALSVLAEPEDLSLSVTEAEIKEGQSVDVQVSFSGDVFGNVEAVQISGDGEVTIEKKSDFDFTVSAAASGTAQVEFSVSTSAGENYSETLTLTIERAVRSIKLLNPVYTLGKGETVDVQPVALDGRGEVIEDEVLSIASAATGRVQIKAGKLFAKSEGTAAITIKAQNGVYIRFNAKVVAAPSAIALNPKSLKITQGETEIIKYSLSKGSASQVTWASANEDVFTLSDMVPGAATVNAVGAGTAVLSVKANAGGKVARIYVTVVPVPTDIVFNAEEYVLEENTTLTALVTGYLPEDAWTKAVEFEIADTTIAEISADGVIRGKRMGETTLTARVTLSGGIVEKTVPVRVVAVAISMDVPSAIKAGKGELLTLAPVAYDRFGEPVDTTFTLKSSNTNYLKVSGLKIKGTSTGKYTLTVTSKAGVARNITVTIVDAPTRIALSAGRMDLEEGASGKLTYSFAPKNGYSHIRWESSDESVAVVDADGSVTAVAPGTAVITAYTFVGNVKASCTVTVYAHVESVQFSQDTVTIYEGESLAPGFAVTPEDSASMVTLDYGEGLEEIASIDKSAGTVKGLRSGSGTLRAVSAGGAVATIQIEVIPAPASIGFEYKRTKLGKGETVDIKPVAYDARGNKLSEQDWPLTLTSNSSYVTVTAEGTVKGSSVGTSRVTATASNGVKAYYNISVLDAPKSITLNAASGTLNIGASVTLRAMWEKQVLVPTWTSSNADVAEVDENGAVTAKAAGTAIITARSYNGKTAKCTITVKPFPESIAFANEEYTVGEGRTVTPKLVVSPANASAVVTYSIEDVNGETIAAVSETGVVSGALSGDAVLVASVTNPVSGETLSASTQIHVVSAPVQIVVDEGTGHMVANDIFYIGIGERIELSITLLDGRGNVVETTPSVVTTNASILKKNGLTFTGIAKGSAYFKITLDNGTVYQRRVQVYDAPTGINNLVGSFNRVAGNQVVTTFKYTKGFGGVTVESSDETVATASVVYSSGALTLTVETLGAGSADITLKTYNNRTAHCTVNVYDEVPTISFASDSVSLSSGSKYTLVPIIEPQGNWGDVTFSIDNDTVASIDANGTLHAVKEGAATVTATCAGGSGQCEVVVIGTLSELDLDLENILRGAGQNGFEDSSATLLKLGKGETVTLVPKTYDGEDEVVSSYTYKTSNSKIAAVNASGMVKGIAEGKATITVTTDGGMRSSFTVQVMSAPSAVKLPAKTALQVGGEASLNPSVNAKQFGRVSWRSYNTNVVTVDETGVLHAVAPGTAKVTVTTYNKKSATITVTVNSAPDSIDFAKEVYDVAFGSEQQVSTSIVTDPAGRAITVSYQFIPDDEDMGAVATVNAKGVVTGLSEGTGRLVATVYDTENDRYLTAETAIVVHRPVASIGFTKATTRIGYHETYTMQAVAYDADGEPVDAPITVASSDAKTARVNGFTLYGVKTGSVTITVAASNGNTSVKRTFKLNVLTSPTKIAIAQGGSIILTVNELRQLSANSNNVNNVQVTWSSSAPEVATVSEDGIVTAHSLGTARIIARNYNGKQAAITVNVCPEAEDISFPVDYTLLGEGGTRTIKAVLPENTGGIITYHSVNPLVAEVNPTTGLVTALKKGETSIVATIYNSTTCQYYTAEYTIHVAGAPVRIEKVYGVTSIAVGERDTWQLKLYDADGEETGSDLTFASSKPKYIPVNGAGLIAGKVVGDTVITVKAYNGVVLKVKVNCYRAPGSVGLNASSVTISEVETYKLSPKFPSGTVSKVTYSSSDPEIADVDANTGLITAHEVGTATVTVKTFNNKTARCQVTVLPEPDGIGVNLSELILNDDGVYSGFAGILNSGHKGVITYVSSNETVASVDPDTGVITAHQAGECQITACTTNRRTGEEYSAAMDLTVIRIVLSTDRTSIGVNEIVNYSAIAYDKDGNVINCDIRPATSNKAIVAVSDYRIKGIKAGSAKITMSAIGNAYVSRTIKVIAAPTSITLSASNNKLTVGYGSLKINYTLKANGAVSAIAWTSSNTDVATVDANGYVSGVAPGTVRITAKTYNNKSAVIDLTVYNPPESIRLNKPSVTLGVGQKETLTHYYNEGEFSEVIYTSSAPDIVSVASNGQLTAVSEGSAVITATTFNGKSATCQVTVNPAPTSVHFTIGTLTIGRGQTYDLSNLVEVNEGATASYTFAVENTSIITKSGASGIYGKANGTTRAKVTTHNGKVALITVKVQTAATIFTVNKSESVLYEGDQVTFSAVMPNGSAASVVFTSDNPEVISISESGVASCLSVGAATISATNANGVVVKSSEYVYSHVSSVELEAEELSLLHYDSYTLGVTVLPETAYDKSVIWSSSDPSAVSVGPGGKLTAHTLSETPVTITVTSVDGGVQDQILVTVLPVRLEGFELSVREAALERGRTINVEAVFTPANADDKTLIWTSGNENVAIVDQLGNITAMADNGAAEITCVSNDGGFTKTVQVTATKVRLTGASASDPTPEVEHYGEVTIVPLLDPVDADVNITWSVSNPAILAVDGNGTLSGLEVGTTNVYATITDYFDNEITLTYSVTVTPVRVTGIELSGTYSRMRTGGQDVFEYTIAPSNADDRNIIINVTPAGIVSAEKTQDGAVTLSALQAGTATVHIITVDQGFEGTIDVQVFDSLTVSATPNLEKTTVNNTVTWELDVDNSIGQLAYQISVTRDGTQLLSQTSYDPAAGISLPANVAGDYQLSVTVTDVDGQTAQTVSTVTVSDTITYTENGNVWVYVVTEVQGQLGASVKLDTLASGVTAVTIPKTMYGAPVVRIDTEAFMGQTTIVSVATPNTVTEIGARAFKGCTGLTSMSTY